MEEDPIIIIESFSTSFEVFYDFKVKMDLYHACREFEH